VGASSREKKSNDTRNILLAEMSAASFSADILPDGRISLQKNSMACLCSERISPLRGWVTILAKSDDN
jgi:hypothetical protein